MVNRLTDQVFYIRENDDWVLKRTQDIFNDKEVVVFGLPGAFTPTCSAFQLPKFEDLYLQKLVLLMILGFLLQLCQDISL